MRGLRIFLLLCLLAWVRPANAQVAQLPFEFIKDKIFIKVRFNNNDSLRFIFDTGATASLIDSASAEQAGLTKEGMARTNAIGSGGAKDYQMAMDQTLVLSDRVSVSGIGLIIMNLKDINKSLGMKVGGIIGYDLLNKYTTGIDFDRKVISFYERGTAVDTMGYTPIAFEFSKGIGIPRFPISIRMDNGEVLTGKVMFDTGASGTLLASAPFSRFHDVGGKIGRTTTVRNRGLNFETTDLRARMKGMSFSGFDFGPMVYELTSFDKAEPKDGYLGILEMEIIKRFNAIIDYNNRKIYLKPNKNFGLPLPDDLDSK